MAMFKIKQAGRMDLVDCKTDSSTMVEADSVRELSAERCEAVSSAMPRPRELTLWAKVWRYILDRTITQIISIGVISIVVVVLMYFGFSPNFL